MMHHRNRTSGLWPDWNPCHCASAWTRLFMTRPRRAKEAAALGRIIKGTVPDEILFPHRTEPYVVLLQKLVPILANNVNNQLSLSISLHQGELKFTSCAHEESTEPYQAYCCRPVDALQETNAATQQADGHSSSQSLPPEKSPYAALTKTTHQR